MQDLFDVACGNSVYITQEQFIEKYKHYFLEIDCTDGVITLRDDHNEWRLVLQKTWCDEVKS